MNPAKTNKDKETASGAPSSQVTFVRRKQQTTLNENQSFSFDFRLEWNKQLEHAD